MAIDMNGPRLTPMAFATTFFTIALALGGASGATANTYAKIASRADRSYYIDLTSITRSGSHAHARTVMVLSGNLVAEHNVDAYDESIDFDCVNHELQDSENTAWTLRGADETRTPLRLQSGPTTPHSNISGAEAIACGADYDHTATITANRLASLVQISRVNMSDIGTPAESAIEPPAPARPMVAPEFPRRAQAVAASAETPSAPVRPQARSPGAASVLLSDLDAPIALREDQAAFRDPSAYADLCLSHNARACLVMAAGIRGVHFADVVGTHSEIWTKLATQAAATAMRSVCVNQKDVQFRDMYCSAMESADYAIRVNYGPKSADTTNCLSLRGTGETRTYYWVDSYGNRVYNPVHNESQHTDYTATGVNIGNSCAYAVEFSTYDDKEVHVLRPHQMVHMDPGLMASLTNLNEIHFRWVKRH
jgi:hypothetical protein